MSILLIAAGVVVIGLAVWIITRGPRRPRSGAHNNWRNEDFLSRDTAGSWTEGATYSKSEPKDVSGFGL